jgi:hypothetical protein
MVLKLSFSSMTPARLAEYWGTNTEPPETASAYERAIGNQVSGMWPDDFDEFMEFYENFYKDVPKL